MTWTKNFGCCAAIAAVVGCAPADGFVGEGSNGAGESAVEDTDSDGEESSGDAGDELEVVDVLLVSSEGATERTSVVVHADVSNLGVAPITSVQLRSFRFAGYFSRSSIVAQPANPEEAMPIEPGETAELRFGYEEAGALFDCAQWEGPLDTDVLLTFAIEGESVEAPVQGHVRCRIVD